VAEPHRRVVNKLFVATVTGMAVVWLILLADLIAAGRWLDLVLVLVVSALVVGAYRLQRRARPFTG
jgi:high-affinity Fe2+/Pb2+ permease